MEKVLKFAAMSNAWEIHIGTVNFIVGEKLCVCLVKINPDFN
jgi:hypothetical protein